MKKVFTTSVFIILLSLLQHEVMASHSSLQVSSVCSQLITVQIGNVMYSNPTNLFQLNTLAPGIYNVQVYRWQRGVGNQFPIYNGPIQIGFNEMVTTVITAPGFAQISRQVFMPQMGTLSAACLTGPNSFVYPYQQNFFGTSGLPYYHQMQQFNGFWPMDMNAFAALKQSIAGAAFESTRLDIARSVISRQYITAAQLRELLQLFTFESTKLEFAKFAYPQVIDRQNIFMIYDVFRFNSSVSELSQFFS